MDKAMNFIKVTAIAIVMGSPIAAEELKCSIRSANDVGGLIPKEALISLSESKATYRDGITYNILSEDMKVKNNPNLSRLKFDYTVDLPLNNGAKVRTQYSVTYVKSTKVISIYAVLSGYDNQAQGAGKCR